MTSRGLTCFQCCLCQGTSEAKRFARTFTVLISALCCIINISFCLNLIPHRHLSITSRSYYLLTPARKCCWIVDGKETANTSISYLCLLCSCTCSRKWKKAIPPLKEPSRVRCPKCLRTCSRRNIFQTRKGSMSTTWRAIFVNQVLASSISCHIVSVPCI